MPKVPPSYLQERREEILGAAINCFGRRGFHQTTMRDICEEAQVSLGAIYRYFKSKDDFIAAASEEYAKRARDLVAQVTSVTPDPKEGLRLIGQHYYGQFHDEAFFDLARGDAELQAETLRDPELRQQSAELLATMRSAFSELIARVPHEDGDTTPDTIANLVIALWFGLQYTKAVDPERVDTDAVFALLQKLLSSLDGQGRAN